MAEPDQTPQKRRWKRVVPIAAFVLVFLIGLAIAIRIQGKKTIQRELQAIRERGYPTSPQEVHEWYAAVPAAENAALGILKAYDLYVEPGNYNPNQLTDGLVLGEPLPPKLAGAIASIVERNGEALSELHAAVKLPKSRYPVDLTPGLASLLPHLTRTKRMAELLKWEAIYHSSRDNRTDAVRAIESGFAIAASLKNEPVMISALVRMSCLWLTFSALERVVTEHQLTEPELNRILVLVRSTEEDSVPSLRRGLFGDRGSGLPAFKMSYRELYGTGGTNSSIELRQVRDKMRFEARRFFGGHRRDLSFYLTTLKRVEATLEKDLAEMVIAGEQLEKDVPAAFHAGHEISYMLLPGVPGSFSKCALLIAQLRTISLALEIEKVRLGTDGRIPLPEDLAKDIVQQLLDPISNRELTFNRLEKGYQIIADASTDLKKKRRGEMKTALTPIAFRVLR